MSPPFPPAQLRRAVQWVFALVCVLVGVQFLRYCQWASDATTTYALRPPAIEGFLPISALLGLKHFALTGQYDPVHPAGLTILLVALATGLLLRKGFCGYVCPVGLASDLLAVLGRRLGIERRVSGPADRLLRLLKYPLLAFFVLTIFLGMDGASVQAFLTSPYNLTADARLLAFFAHPSPTALAVFGLLGLASLTVRNPWCRWLCPYGALLGLLAWPGPMAMRRDAENCTGCGRCQQACPASIPVQRLAVVRHPECLGCAQCLAACSRPEGPGSTGRAGALRCSYAGLTVPWFAPATGTVALFLAAWGLARATGHWDNGLAPQILKAFYKAALTGF